MVEETLNSYPYWSCELLQVMHVIMLNCDNVPDVPRRRSFTNGQHAILNSLRIRLRNINRMNAKTKAISWRDRGSSIRAKA